MTEPRREPVTGIVLHGAQFGRHAERVGDPFRGPLVVGGKGRPYVTIVEYRIVLAVGFLDLIKRLRDQEALQAVSGHEGERGLEKIEPSERREFIEHEKQSLPPCLCKKLFGQPAADLIEKKTDQRSEEHTSELQSQSK